MSNKSVRRSIVMTPEMRDLLAQLAARQAREVSKSDLVGNPTKTKRRGNHV